MGIQRIKKNRQTTVTKLLNVIHSYEEALTTNFNEGIRDAT